MWVRGLKLQSVSPCWLCLPVAPYVGAWIETCMLSAGATGAMVAPYVGAWIETSPVPTMFGTYKSHPMWVRGLKHLYKCPIVPLNQSHPMWVRGLKLK